MIDFILIIIIGFAFFSIVFHFEKTSSLIDFSKLFVSKLWDFFVFLCKKIGEACKEFICEQLSLQVKQESKPNNKHEKHENNSQDSKHNHQDSKFQNKQGDELIKELIREIRILRNENQNMKRELKEDIVKIRGNVKSISEFIADM